jgi:hypothetical protein
VASGRLFADEIDFTRDIRPILSDKCFACHGPDDDHREGGFRLDVLESALGEADSGERPIVPGEAEASEVLRRLTTDDEFEVMPPADSDKKISVEEIALIRRWIADGAPWKQHWAFLRPQRPQPPKVAAESWVANPIDAFILAKLEGEGLQPNERADKATLLRRLTLDLTGLPPSLEEIEAFLADDSPKAYDRVVRRLLRSPRYGEHMARFWLDAARYGDTHGLHLDNYREMWPYRDWVVQAFNRNQPFDQFIVEQLAGDLLPEPTLDQLVATGFNRCHITTNEGGSIKEEVYVRNVVDRVVTTGTVMMGLTFECTRCHDHKYDPFTMEDFYSLFSYFNSIDGEPLDGNKKDHAPVIRVPGKRQQNRLDNLAAQIVSLEGQLNGPWPSIDAGQQAWEQELLAAADEEDNAIELGEWYWVGPFTENLRYLKNRKHGPEGQEINLAQEFTVGTGEKLHWVPRWEWMDAEPHTNLPGDTAANFLYRKITAPAATSVPISLGSGDGIKVYLNNKQILNKDVTREVAADQERLDLKLNAGDNHLLLKIMNHGGPTGFCFALKSGKSRVPVAIVEAAKTDLPNRTDQQKQYLRNYYRYHVADSVEFKKVKRRLAALRRRWSDVDRTIPCTLIWREASSPREAFVLARGEYDQPGDKVSRRTPQVLPPMDPSLPQNRLGLAHWLVSSEHPLTARVAVNRFWQQFFGVGIVKTAEDFGSQGEPPSHPALLDWLAVDFVESGWDVRALVKQIVTSNAYQQSSRGKREKYDRDPENRLVARGPRFRLDAEVLRDQALAVSGLLVEQLGGPSVKPPQPDGLWFAVGYSGSNTVRFVGDEGSDKIHRRTLYTFIKRTAPPPQMGIVDAPSREACVVRRERTNTPLQALLLMNDPQYFEAARALARRTLREGGETIESRAAYLFRLCACRHADPWEIEELVKDYRQHEETFCSNRDACDEVVDASENGSASDEDPAELAAWTMVANLVLNLDEVLSKN